MDVSKCQYYNKGKCRIPHYEQGIKFVSCNCGEWDCYYKQLCKVSEKLENIDGIAYYRMGEVDTHLRNRLVDIQNVIRGD